LASELQIIDIYLTGKIPCTLEQGASISMAKGGAPVTMKMVFMVRIFEKLGNVSKYHVRRGHRVKILRLVQREVHTPIPALTFKLARYRALSQADKQVDPWPALKVNLITPARFQAEGSLVDKSQNFNPMPPLDQFLEFPEAKIT
jgi:hypothetical protein